MPRNASATRFEHIDAVSEAPPWPEVWVEPEPASAFLAATWAGLDAMQAAAALPARLDDGAPVPVLWDLLTGLTAQPAASVLAWTTRGWWTGCGGGRRWSGTPRRR